MARLPKPSGVCRLVFVAAGLVGGSVANVGSFAYTRCRGPDFRVNRNPAADRAE